MTPKDGEPAKIRIQDLVDDDAIFRAVRKQCIESPLTIIPIALAAGMLLLTGAFSWGFAGVFASIILGVFGAAAFVFNLWVRGETLARKQIRRLMEGMKSERHAALAEVGAMCEGIGFAEAAKEARELSDAYSRYTGFLETRAGAKLGTAIGQRLELAEAARASGVAHLRRAAEIHVALSGISITALREEVETWRQEKKSSAMPAVLESKIAAHMRQIERYEQLAVMRGDLIARANELESALKSAHLSDAGRQDLADAVHGDNPAARLSAVIAAAESAEAEMSGFLHEVTQTTERNQ
jgi:hypothetical protein